MFSKLKDKMRSLGSWPSLSAAAGQTAPATSFGRGLFAVLTVAAMFVAGATTASAQSGSWASYRDTSWPTGHMNGATYAASTSFTIHNAEQLAQFSWMVAQGNSFLGKTVTLANGKYTDEINLSAHYWDPIGRSNAPFRGTFDGSGKMIRGLTMNAPVTANGELYYSGFFYLINGATVRNMKFADVNINVTATAPTGQTTTSAGGYVGVCVASATASDIDALIEDIFVESGSITAYIDNRNIPIETAAGMRSSSIGGIVGYAGFGMSAYHNVFIRNCSNLATVNVKSHLGNTIIYIGGILGQGSNINWIPIKNCLSGGNITLDSTSSGRGFYIGGILGGGVNDGQTYFAYMSNCFKSGNISAPVAPTGATFIGYGHFMGSSPSSITGGDYENLLYYGTVPAISGVQRAFGRIATATPTGTYAYPGIAYASLMCSSYLNTWVNSNNSGGQPYRIWQVVSGVNGGHPSLVNTFDSTMVAYHGNSGDPACQVKASNLTGIPNTYQLPTSNPTRTGYTFTGWFTAASGGTQITGSTVFSSTSTTDVYAHWQANATPLTGVTMSTTTPTYGTAVTATLAPAGATATYQWSRADSAGGPFTAISGATGSSYTLVAADVDKFLRVTATGSGSYSGTATATSTSAVAKATPAAPSAPTMASSTTTSITLNAISGAQYRVNGGAWQSGTTFSGLTPGTSYTFEARLAETATHNASPASGTASFSTVAANYSISATVTQNSIAFGSVTYGYAPRTAATVTITNTGNMPFTFVSVTGHANYTVSAPSSTTIAVGGTATFTIAPANGLPVGSYNSSVTITATNGGNGDVIHINPSFTVTKNTSGTWTAPSGGPYTLTYGQTLAQVAPALPAGYTFNAPSTVPAAGSQSHAATFDDGNQSATGIITLNVAKAPATLTINAGQTKVYDGTGWTTCAVTATGLVNGDTFATAFAGTFGGLPTSANVGTYPITRGSVDAANYNVTSFTGASLEITKKVGGWVHPNGGNDYTLTYGQTLESIAPALPEHYSFYTVDPAATIPPAGDNQAFIVLFDDGNQAQGNIIRVNVAKAVVTVTPDSGQSKVSGAADPVLTYTAGALLAGNSFTGALSRNDANGNTAGAFEITIGTLSAGGNYTISLVGGKMFTVSAAATYSVTAPTNTGILPGTATQLQPYSGTITANAGYNLPSGITSVTVGGTALTAGQFSYNNATGAFSISNGALINGGDIVITATGANAAQPITYSVVFNSNYSGGPTLIGQVHTYDVALALSHTGLTRAGYTFAGWNTNPGGTGIAYANGQSVQNLSTVANDTVNLYAQWTAATDGIIVPDTSTPSPADTDYFVVTDGDGGDSPTHPSKYDPSGDEDLVDVHPGNEIDHVPGEDGYIFIVPDVPGFPNGDGDGEYDYVFDPSVPAIYIIDNDDPASTNAVVHVPSGIIESDDGTSNWLYLPDGSKPKGSDGKNRYFKIDRDVSANANVVWPSAYNTNAVFIANYGDEYGTNLTDVKPGVVIGHTHDGAPEYPFTVPEVPGYEWDGGAANGGYDYVFCPDIPMVLVIDENGDVVAEIDVPTGIITIIDPDTGDVIGIIVPDTSTDDPEDYFVIPGGPGVIDDDGNILVPPGTEIGHGPDTDADYPFVVPTVPGLEDPEDDDKYILDESEPGIWVIDPGTGDTNAFIRIPDGVIIIDGGDGKIPSGDDTILVPDTSTGDPEDYFIIPGGPGVIDEDGNILVPPGTEIGHGPDTDADYPFVVPTVPGLEDPENDDKYILDESIPGIWVVDPGTGDTNAFIHLPDGVIIIDGGDGKIPSGDDTILVPDTSTSRTDDYFVFDLSDPANKDVVFPSVYTDYLVNDEGREGKVYVDVTPGVVIGHTVHGDGYFTVPAHPDYPYPDYHYVFDPMIPTVLIIDPQEPLGPPTVVTEIPAPDGLAVRGTFSDIATQLYAEYDATDEFWNGPQIVATFTPTTALPVGWPAGVNVTISLSSPPTGPLPCRLELIGGAWRVVTAAPIPADYVHMEYRPTFADHLTLDLTVGENTARHERRVMLNYHPDVTEAVTTVAEGMPNAKLGVYSPCEWDYDLWHGHPYTSGSGHFIENRLTNGTPVTVMVGSTRINAWLANQAMDSNNYWTSDIIGNIPAGLVGAGLSATYYFGGIDDPSWVYNGELTVQASDPYEFTFFPSVIYAELLHQYAGTYRPEQYAGTDWADRQTIVALNDQYMFDARLVPLGDGTARIILNDVVPVGAAVPKDYSQTNCVVLLGNPATISDPPNQVGADDTPVRVYRKPVITVDDPLNPDTDNPEGDEVIGTFTPPASDGYDGDTLLVGEEIGVLFKIYRYNGNEPAGEDPDATYVDTEYKGYVINRGDAAGYRICLTDPLPIVPPGTWYLGISTDESRLGPTETQRGFSRYAFSVDMAAIDLAEAVTAETGPVLIGTYEPNQDYDFGDWTAFGVVITIGGNGYDGYIDSACRIYIDDAGFAGIAAGAYDIAVEARGPFADGEFYTVAATESRVPFGEEEPDGDDGIDVIDPAAGAGLAITAIRVYKDDDGKEWVDVDVEGCKNYSKSYALFGREALVAKAVHNADDEIRSDGLTARRASAGAPLRYAPSKAEIIGMGAAPATNADGERTFTFPKPADGRHFYHAREVSR